MPKFKLWLKGKKLRVSCDKLEKLSKFAHQGDRVFEGLTLQKDVLMED